MVFHSQIGSPEDGILGPTWKTSDSVKYPSKLENLLEIHIPGIWKQLRLYMKMYYFV